MVCRYLLGEAGLESWPQWLAFSRRNGLYDCCLIAALRIALGIRLKGDEQAGILTRCVDFSGGVGNSGNRLPELAVSLFV